MATNSSPFLVLAKQNLDKMQRNYDDVNEMLKRLERELNFLDDKMDNASVIPMTIRSPALEATIPSKHHQVQSPAVEVKPKGLPKALPRLSQGNVSKGFDLSKVDPILREAAEDTTLRIHFVDCSDLAMQCARLREN